MFQMFFCDLLDILQIPDEKVKSSLDHWLSLQVTIRLQRERQHVHRKRIIRPGKPHASAAHCVNPEAEKFHKQSVCSPSTRLNSDMFAIAQLYGYFLALCAGG